ncbi:DOMON-like domain-containing protein [Sphingomonas populi]|uniref:DOMON-like domain-containing protein n=1 Tax=Sphingomonas populi TaxID=2484750 RepID=A0A4V2DDX4_9SPHN|nr:DOMON-like domain-containing protein [Sphingomonas populi]RZF66498.1 DOMON-like domain-containing protein [Sphingomonas populi]
MAGRTDELWRHGCLEVFLAGEGDSYLEINLAPTERWAAYAFDRYRDGMRNAEVSIAKMHWTPRLALSIPRYEMSAVMRLPAEMRGVIWRLNITAVIEAKDGSKSYWALAHPPGAPDFHNRDGFVAILPA